MGTLSSVRLSRSPGILWCPRAPPHPQNAHTQTPAGRQCDTGYVTNPHLPPARRPHRLRPQPANGQPQHPHATAILGRHLGSLGSGYGSDVKPPPRFRWRASPVPRHCPRSRHFRTKRRPPPRPFPEGWRVGLTAPRFWTRTPHDGGALQRPPALRRRRAPRHLPLRRAARVLRSTTRKGVTPKKSRRRRRGATLRRDRRAPQGPLLLSLLSSSVSEPG